MPRYCGANVRPAASSGSVLRNARASRNPPSRALMSASVTSRARGPSRPLAAKYAVPPSIHPSKISWHGLPEFFDGVGDLRADAGDGTHVGESGRRHVLGGLSEHPVDRRAEVGVFVDDRGDEQAVRSARVDQRLARDLHLAAAEVVVQRADRRARGLGDVLHAHTGVTLVPHQLGGRRQDRFPGGPCHDRLLLSR